MFTTGNPTSKHLARATVSFRHLDLKMRTLQMLLEGLKAKYDEVRLPGPRPLSQQQSQWDRETDWGTVRNVRVQILTELSQNWPEDLRQHLLANLSEFTKIQPQQMQQRQQQQQQNQQQQQQTQQLEKLSYTQSSPAAQLFFSLNGDEERLREEHAKARQDLEAIQEVGGNLDASTAETLLKQQEQERVNFCIYAPAGVPSGNAFVVDVWAFLGEQREKVRALAERLVQSAVQERSEVMVNKAAILSVELDSSSLEIEKATQWMTWNGIETSASFKCTLNPQTNLLPSVRRRGLPCQIVVRCAGFQLATLKFVIQLSKTMMAGREKVAEFNQTPVTAFASYSSTDRVDVLRGADGLRKGAPFLNIILDIDKLRSGDNWEQKLIAFIRQSDVMYLFWSRAAAKSAWVDREWRQGLREKGIGFIDPFPLESPQLAPPPPELSALHFNSNYLAYIEAEKYRQAELAAMDKEK